MDSELQVYMCDVIHAHIKCYLYTCTDAVSVMCLSYLVNSFVEIIEFLFSLPDVSLFLSNRLCQDPLEKFFGQQRQRGRVNENPNVVDFLRNTQALRVINTTCLNIRGNCRGSNKTGQGTGVENVSLPKRKSKHSMV